MEGQATRYAVLRDGAHWEGVTTDGLEAEAGGALVLRLADAAGQAPHTAEGLLEVGPLPLDAGERADWERVVVEAEVPAGTSVALEVFAHAEPEVAEGEVRWKSLPTLDALVPPADEWGEGGPGGLRFLRLRVRLRSEDAGAVPRLIQVRAATAGETYLDYLPAFYRRDEETRRFLSRWLGLFRAELGDLEAALEQMPRDFEPALAREESLPWLAAWLAFELPHGRGPADARGFLRRASRLYERRGTPAGLAEFVELYAGVRPRIVEEFAERKLWQLDLTSALGVDTILPSPTPGGFVVPDADVRPAVGEVVVGESGPLRREQFGETLFDAAAHRFRVVVPRDGADDALLRAVERIVEAEKPAHTEYRLCVEGEEDERHESPEEAQGAEASASAEAGADESNPEAGEESGAQPRASAAEESAPLTTPPADAELRVEAVEFLDARGRVVGALGRDAEEAKFHVSEKVNAVRVRFTQPVDVSSVVTGGKREDPERFSFLLQASWSRRAAKYVPGAVFLDTRDTRAVRFVPVTARGSLREGRYTVTLRGGADASGPAVRDMDGKQLRGGGEGGDFVFRFQIGD